MSIDGRKWKVDYATKVAFPFSSLCCAAAHEVGTVMGLTHLKLSIPIACIILTQVL